MVLLIWYRKQFALARPDQLKGDITPEYGILDVDTIRHVHQAVPDCKLFYLMRNPVERAWSGALMALWRSELSFEEVSDQWFIDHFKSEGSIKRGDYEACLKNWLAVYPASQLLPLFLDQIESDPIRVLIRCADHLGVDPSPFVQAPVRLVSKPEFQGPAHPLRESLRPILEEMYLPKMESLGSFLGIGDPWEPGKRPAAHAEIYLA